MSLLDRIILNRQNLDKIIRWSENCSDEQQKTRHERMGYGTRISEDGKYIFVPAIPISECCCIKKEDVVKAAAIVDVIKQAKTN